MEQVAIGYVIGFIFAGIVGLAGLLFIVGGAVSKEYGYMLGGVAAVIAALIIGLINAYPFDRAYHYYKPVSGTVASINSRILRDSDGNTSQKIAVKLDNGLVYGCEDTRCTVLEKGDKASLLCIREWQFRGVPGYNCKYNGAQ